METPSKLKPANDYIIGLDRASADDLVKQFAGLLDDIANDWIIDPSTSEAALIYDTITSTIRAIAMYFSRVYLDDLVLIQRGTRVDVTDDDIVKKIEQIVSCISTGWFITGAMTYADFTETRDKETRSSEHVQKRSRQINDRFSHVMSALILVESIARDWLEQHEKEME